MNTPILPPVSLRIPYNWKYAMDIKKTMGFILEQMAFAMERIQRLMGSIGADVPLTPSGWRFEPLGLDLSPLFAAARVLWFGVPVSRDCS